MRDSKDKMVKMRVEPRAEPPSSCDLAAKMPKVATGAKVTGTNAVIKSARYSHGRTIEEETQNLQTATTERSMRRNLRAEAISASRRRWINSEALVDHPSIFTPLMDPSNDDVMASATCQSYLKCLRTIYAYRSASPIRSSMQLEMHLQKQTDPTTQMYKLLIRKLISTRSKFKIAVGSPIDKTTGAINTTPICWYNMNMAQATWIRVDHVSWILTIPRTILSTSVLMRVTAEASVATERSNVTVFL